MTISKSTPIIINQLLFAKC